MRALVNSLFFCFLLFAASSSVADFFRSADYWLEPRLGLRGPAVSLAAVGENELGPEIGYFQYFEGENDIFGNDYYDFESGQKFDPSVRSVALSYAYIHQGNSLGLRLSAGLGYVYGEWATHCGEPVYFMGTIEYCRRERIDIPGFAMGASFHLGGRIGIGLFLDRLVTRRFTASNFGIAIPLRF